MKIKSLNETRFKRNDSFVQHYLKHVANSWSEYFFETTDEHFEPMSQDEYDDAADKLSKRRVRTSNVDSPDMYVGFVASNGRIVKYGKSLDEIVIYVSKSPVNSNTVTYYKLNHLRAKRRYNELKAKDYVREINEMDDKYNV